MVSEMEKKRKELVVWLSSLADTREWIARVRESKSKWYVVTYLYCTVHTN